MNRWRSPRTIPWLTRNAEDAKDMSNSRSSSVSGNLPRIAHKKPFGGPVLPFSFTLQHSPLGAIRVIGYAFVIGGFDPKAGLKLLHYRVLTVSLVPCDVQS